MKEPSYVTLKSPDNFEILSHRNSQQRRRMSTWFGCLVAVSVVLLTSLLSVITVSNFLGPSGDAERLSYSSGEISVRRRREVGERLKAGAEEALMKLMREEPSCRADCERLEAQLKQLGGSIDLTMERLMSLKEEIRILEEDCRNKTGVEDSRDEIQLDLTHQHPQTGRELDEMTGRAADDKIIDHDLAASAMQEVRHPRPLGYPWSPAPEEVVERIPPTGPDGSLGPGEAVHTSQQLSVTLPERMEKVCSLVPGPPGSSGYLCSPVRDLMAQEKPSKDNFYIQVVRRNQEQEERPQTHVPTAISTPNPYAFPTLSGSPVIVPASAASPNQLIPVYNPKDGRILLQNYPQSIPVYTTGPQQQFPYGGGSYQYGLPQYMVQQPGGHHYTPPQGPQHPASQGLQYTAPLGPQYMAPQGPQYTAPQGPQYMAPQGPQYMAPQGPPYTAPQGPQYTAPQYSFPVPQIPSAPQYIFPQYAPQPYYQPPPTRPIVLYNQQPQFPPAVVPHQVYVPQYAGQQPADLQCTYVIVPNSPVRNYKFPTVSGVSETIQRSEDSPKNIEGKKIEASQKDSVVSRGNTTTDPKYFYASHCAPGTRSCADGISCIETEEWCDRVIDCPDASDESTCLCKERILPEKFCDGYFDCPEGEDELGCSGCEVNMFSCDDPQAGVYENCLPIEKRCDFIKDCRNGKDEMDCNLISDVHHAREVSIISYSRGFLFRNWKGVWYPVCNAEHWLLDACSAEIGPLTGPPQWKFSVLEKYDGQVANQVTDGVRLSSVCKGKPGIALWVECPEPACGLKPAKPELSTRFKRDLQSPVTYPPHNYVDNYPHTDEPNFQTTPEAMQFVKNFFNSLSIFDRRKFYKRLWGPLVQPYMGVKDTADHQQQENESQLKSDPSQMSWQHYLRPYQRTMESFDPENYFPSYQDAMHYGNLDPYDLLPMDFHNYPSYPGQNYFSNSGEPYYMPDYMRSVWNAAEFGRLKREEATLRVVGGSRSEPGAWPWIVIVYRDGEFHCGGTIVTNYIILTAAHCLDNFEGHYFEVQAGLLRRLSYSPQEQIRMVDEVLVHEDYDKKTMNNDIALMKLSHPLKYNRWVLPACLPPAGYGEFSVPQPGMFCTAIGWGSTFEHGPDPDHLREVQVPILPSCKHKEDRIGNEICAGFPEGGKDTCQGDSGGPLICRLNNKWVIAGIVSHGKGCGRLGEPGVYTRVSLFMNWIKSNLAWSGVTRKSSGTICPGVICKTGRCLPESSQCDYLIDCLGGEDELGCDHSNNTFKTSNLHGESRAVITLKPTISIQENNKPENQTTNEKPMSVNFTASLHSNTTDGAIALDNSESLHDGEETSVFESSIEETILHSQQTHSVDISNLFNCNRFHQRVLASRVCDDIVDCEDASDEEFCNCKQRLLHIAPGLICNGFTDCYDTTDELDCPAICDTSEFYCQNSKICIPITKRCDLEKDCHFGEDEEDCYALFNDTIHIDSGGYPVLRLSGKAAVYSQFWKFICVDSRKPAALALNVCENLGFRIAADYNLINESKGNETEKCTLLQVRCTSPVDRVWIAPIFNSGSPLSIGVLIAESWILAPTAGLNFPDSYVYLNTWLGKTNFTMKIRGFYDQYIRIDGLKTIGEGEVTLLHLQAPAEINRMAVPLTFPDWPTKVNEMEECEAIGLSKTGSLISVNLKPTVNCKKGKRCYNMVDKNKTLCYIVGVVVCKSEHGSYISSVVSENLCEQTIELSDLTFKESSILNEIETGTYENLKEGICDTLRCETGECLEWSRIGNGVSDCFDGRDEKSLSWLKKDEHCKKFGEECNCRPGEIRCPKGNCIDSRKFCDGAIDCVDASDEANCNCWSYLSLARPEQLCNGIQNCHDKSDEKLEYCMNHTNCSDSQRSICPSSKTCFPNSYICDGDNDCPDGEDEEMCIAIQSRVDRPKEGLLYSRLYGEVIPQCLEKHDDSLPEKLCSLRDFNGTAHSHYSNVPYSYVLTDVFSRVHLNSNLTLSLRTNRKFASVEQNKNRTCSVLYVECT